MSLAMKTIWCSFLTILLGASAMGPGSAAARAETAQRPLPLEILSVGTRGADLLVTVRVPPGLRRVTLESRPRLTTGAWLPRAAELTSGEGEDLTFTLPRSETAEVFRARGDTLLELPASFYDGPTEFPGEPSWGFRGFNPIDAIDAPGAGQTPEQDEGREVQESDIWRIRGDTLFFFNQLRGLQVIDVSDPDAPRIRARLNLPAVGEDMYVLGDSRVALLARASCAWPSTSEILIVNIEDSEVSVESVLPIDGAIQESRLVGTALYVVAQSWREREQMDEETGESLTVWEWGSHALSFDLSEPGSARKQDELWFPGQGNVIAATDRWLFVVTQERGNWWQSLITLVDISDSAGMMIQAGAIRPAGRVADKFKLHVDDDVLSVVSEASRRTEFREQVSVLENYSLSRPEKPDKLGEVRVGRGESLFATRFDGDRAYIVTFLRIDPLWVIDLSDPRNPRVAGELEIPGWSTYIHPLGDRLVTVGIDNTESWKVAVQLFDVGDPANPSLLSKVPLGENSSWSEATHDEKAFRVLENEGLILVPYQGWTGEGSANRLQLIDLLATELVPRGYIEHGMSARRATSHAGRILSISGNELVAVDAADRDAPKTTASLELAWAVDRLVLDDNYLRQVSEGYSWDATPAPRIRVTSNDSPDSVLNEMTPRFNWPIVGHATKSDLLYVLQVTTEYNGGIPEEEGQEVEIADNVALSVYSVRSLPALELIGETTAYIDAAFWGGDMAPLWPLGDLLVWCQQGGGYWRGWIDVPMADMAIAPGRWYPWWGGGGGQHWVFDVSDPAEPSLRSAVDLTAEGEFWAFSEAKTTGGLIFRSSQRSEFEPLDIKPENPDERPVEGRWMTRHFLNVIDLTDPDEPSVRQPVNIPGVLRDVSAQGALITTQGPHYDDEGTTDWIEHLDVCAYDGTKAALIASLRLENAWPRPLKTPAGWLLQRPDGNEGTGVILETWGLTDQGEFEREGSLALDYRLDEWIRLDDSVLARRSGFVDLFDASGNSPAWVASGELPNCLWFDLEQATLAQDAWIPSGSYGVRKIQLSP